MPLYLTGERDPAECCRRWARTARDASPRPRLIEVLVLVGAVMWAVGVAGWVVAKLINNN